MGLMNRLTNAANPYQGEFKKVLCVCSAGLLRSPTAAWVLSQEPFNYNTRAAGIESEFALIVVDKILIAWADEIVCMTREQEKKLKELTNKSIINLEIEDDFQYRDPKLVELIKERYTREAANA